MKKLKYNGIIFDLDGTLLDTLDDIKNSINKVLQSYNLEIKTKEFVRNAVGNGYKVFVDKCVDKQYNHLKEQILNEYSKDYAENCKILTKPYDGVIELLKELKRLNIKTAIVSNKGDDAVKELTSLYFDGLIDDAYGVGKNILPKPDPSLLNYALEKLNLDRNNVLYIGDSDVDINTSRNAGIRCISVSWGFRDKEFLIKNGAETIIDQPDDILNIIYY